MNRYFISYMFQASSGIAAGNCEISLPVAITSMRGVRTITEYLRNQGLKNPTVMAFSRFDSDTADAGDHQ
jgi:hypothetical protein